MVINSSNSEDMNRRLSLLFNMIDETSLECGTHPTLPNLQAYYTQLEQVYLNVYCILLEEQQEEINKIRESYVRAYERILSNAYNETPPNLLECYTLYAYLKRINALIITYLQEQQYFFTREQKNVKKAPYTTYEGITERKPPAKI